MALKKISYKKLREVVSEAYKKIYKGDFSHIIEILNKHKMDLQTVDPEGCTFLWAVGTGLNILNPPKENRNIIACMQFLINHGADVNHKINDGCTALFLVAGNGRSNPEAVEMLIRNGADVHCQDNDGSVALVRAIAGFEDNKPEAFTPLLKAGADPYHKLNRKLFGCDSPMEMVERNESERQTQLKAAFQEAVKKYYKKK